MDKLQLYNITAHHCGERALASLTEDQEIRHKIDEVYDHVLRLCLEEEDWLFATKTVQIDFNPSLEPDFGYRRVFDKPDDMIRVSGIYSYEYMHESIRNMVDEGKYWFSDYDTLYVEYVSSEKGLDLGRWDNKFSDFVALSIASFIAPTIKNDIDQTILAAKLRTAKREAQGFNNIKRPAKSFPRGAWSRARHAGSYNRGEKYYGNR